MRSIVAVSVAVAALAGCGGGDDQPDLAAPLRATETVASELGSTTPQKTAPTTGAATFAAPTRLRPQQRSVIATQAKSAAGAIGRWNRSLASCIGPSGNRDDVGASCTRAAWDQLFDQMYAVQYELLALVDRIDAGPCRETLESAIDGVHGFLAGATPLKVVWLDDRQRPPGLFDLQSIVDVVRPVSAQMREALGSICKA